MLNVVNKAENEKENEVQHQLPRPVETGNSLSQLKLSLTLQNIHLVGLGRLKMCVNRV